MFIKCDYCGKEFKTSKCFIKRTKTHCCSNECRAKFRMYDVETGQYRNRKIIKCDNCNKEFVINKFFLKRSKNHCCSVKCSGIMRRLNIEGGLFKNRETIQNEVKLRDGNKCTMCGRNDIRLCVHHIDGSQNENDWLTANNSLDNLTTLCSFCHALTHKGIKKPEDTINRHKKIIKMREEGKTFKFIADNFGLSGERIRQICKKAI